MTEKSFRLKDLFGPNAVPLSRPNPVELKPYRPSETGMVSHSTDEFRGGMAVWSTSSLGAIPPLSGWAEHRHSFDDQRKIMLEILLGRNDGEL